MDYTKDFTTATNSDQRFEQRKSLTKAFGAEKRKKIIDNLERRSIQSVREKFKLFKKILGNPESHGLDCVQLGEQG